MLMNKIPDNVKEILMVLNNAGFEAYVVGGAVRDLLLGREPGDFDITTNARPQQVQSVCADMGWKVIDNLGQNFGCTVVVVKGEACEITTFRGERYGACEAHKPSEVWYCQTLKEDLSRRDFTINAMAIDIRGEIYDYFGGQEDIRNKVLRTVGKAAERFREDALRMFRACRFVAQLGFTYVQTEGVLPAFGQEGTPYYLEHNFDFPLERCSGLSLERVRKELEKLLVAPYASKGLMLLVATGLSDVSCRVKSKGEYREIKLLPELRHLVGLPQNTRFHCYDTWEHTLFAVDNSRPDLLLRWVMLLHDIGKGLPGIRMFREDGSPGDHGHEHKSAEMAVDIFERLGYGNKFARLAIWLISRHMRYAPVLIFKEGRVENWIKSEEKTLLRWLRSEAKYLRDNTEDPAHVNFRNQSELVEAFELLGEVFIADMGATHAYKNEELMQQGRDLAALTVELAKEHIPIASVDLALDGHSLKSLIPEKMMKDYISYLVERIQSGSLANTETALRAAIEKKLQK